MCIDSNMHLHKLYNHLLTLTNTFMLRFTHTYTQNNILASQFTICLLLLEYFKAQRDHN